MHDPSVSEPEFRQLCTQLQSIGPGQTTVWIEPVDLLNETSMRGPDAEWSMPLDG